MALFVGPYGDFSTRDHEIHPPSQGIPAPDRNDHHRGGTGWTVALAETLRDNDRLRVIPRPENR